MSKRKSKKASPNQIINESRQNNNILKTKSDNNVNIKINSIKEKFKGLKYKSFFEKHKKTLILATVALIGAVGVYVTYYSNMPILKETHSKEINGVLASYDAELHPFEILSSDRKLLSEAKGQPTSKGDGKTDETKFVVYTFEWFGRKRETILYYDKQQHFNRVKLKIGNESAKDLNTKLTELLGEPVENNDPTVKGGHAIWIKDSVQYKLIHHGGYATVEMKLARYENTANLKVGKNPLVIQKLYKQDTNKDEKLESIMLLGNKKDQFSTNYNYLHLILWDGKTYSIRMPANMDGGAYPQLEIKDIDGDGKDEIIVSSDNNDVVKNYNVFKFNGQKLEQTYSGHDEPEVINKEQ